MSMHNAPFISTNILNLRNVVVMSLLALTFGIFSLYINIDLVNAQNSAEIINFPDVNLIDNRSNQIASFNHEFTLIQGNTTEGDNKNAYSVKVMDPNFSLESPFAKLTKGERYIINPPNESDLLFINATVKIANVQFMNPDTDIEDADPEDPDQMTLGSLIDLGNQTIGSAGFVLPSEITPGNYIMYVYLQYSHGISGIFSNYVTIIN